MQSKVRGPIITLTLAMLGALSACHSSTQPDSDPMAWMIGTWSGTRRSADDGREAPMTLRVESLPDGRGQVECLRVEGDSGPYMGFASRLQDAVTGKWTMIYANSTKQNFARLEGRIEGANSTWTSVTLGRTRESRLVLERRDANSWRRTQYVSEDGGKNWRVLFTDELVRSTGK